MTAIASTGAGPFLYALGGGTEAALFSAVDRAPIAADGSVGAWTSDTALPVAVGGMAGGLVGSVMVLAGGMTMAGTTDKSWTSVVREDGSLSAWTERGTIAHRRMHPGSFAKDDALYVMGGFDDASVWDDIVRATASPDGTLSAWTPAGKLPSPRSHFALSFADGYVYLTGGLEASANGNPPPLDSVARGRVAEDGTVGEWTPMPPLPIALCTHASFVYGGYLYVVGGLDGSYAHSKRVWRAPLDPDHVVGGWRLVAALPTARAHVHQLPIFGDHVYSVAGAVDQALRSTDEIAIGSFR